VLPPPLVLVAILAPRVRAAARDGPLGVLRPDARWA